MMRRTSATALVAGALLALATLACGGSERGPTPTPSRAGPTATASPAGPTATPGVLYLSELGHVTVRSVCVVVDQTYSGVEGKSPEPIADGIAEILSGVGVRTGAAGSDCDATLGLVLEGKPIACEYQNWGECHSGAQFTGQLTLVVEGSPSQQVDVRGWYSCPFEITKCAEPTEAPFERAWRETLLRGLSHFWGPEILLQAMATGDAWHREVAADELRGFGADAGVVAALAQALDDGSSDVRLAAVESLLEIGPDAIDALPALIDAIGDGDLFVRTNAAEAIGRFDEAAADAVPALIALLDDRYPGPRKAAATALHRITGERFGEDAAAWQAWLDAEE